MNHQMAQHIQSRGRGDDSVLVHMTPGEVSGLQALAMAHGGSLTINPETGLAEAGFLKSILPMVLGAIATPLTGGAINPLTASLLIGGGTAAITGDLKEGLMAGISAYGGAALGAAAGLNAGSFGIGAAGKAAAAAKAATAANVAGGAGSLSAATAPAAQATLSGATQVVPGAVSAGAAPIGAGAVSGGLGAATQAVAPATLSGATQVIPTAVAPAAKTGLAGFAQRFGDAAKAGLPAGTPGFVAKAAPLLAASGVMNSVSGALSGGVAGPSGQIDNSYQGPYFAQDRQRILDPEGPLTSRQRRHFAVAMPEIYNTMGQVTQPGSNTVRGTQIMQPVLNPKAKKGQPMYSFVPITYQGGIEPNPGSYTGYARGGEIELADGAFVVDARTVSEIGNGSSNAGIEALRRLGGRPVQGRGDGVSDSVPARIGKRQPARVARDEVIIPADAVRRLGKGNPKRGADKLYALMNKAHKARKKAGRGQDTKLRRGLA
jgi:hypothetical protein